MKTIKSDSSHTVEYYRNLGMSSALGKDYKNAIKEFNRALKIGPLDQGSLIGRGYCYYQLGYKTQAIEDWGNAGKLGMIPKQDSTS
jgi:Flp pilus assembly protein TadD